MNNAPILEAWDAPCPELVALTLELDRRLSQVASRGRARQPREQERYLATLTAIAAGVATIALSRRPSPGLCVPMGYHDYSFTSISISELRNARDGLERLGLIRVEHGFHDRDDPKGSRYTRFHPTPEFRGLVGDLTLRSLIRPPTNPVMLRRPEFGGPPPREIEECAAFLRRLNEAYGQHSLTLPHAYLGQYDPERVFLRRIFKYDYERVGRLYGGFWIDLPRTLRSQLLLDGERMVELDYRTLHPSIMFAQAGRPLDFDPYEVPGFEGKREAGKRNFMRLLNGRQPIPQYRDAEKDDFPSRAIYRQFVQALTERLEPIADRFGVREGLRLQKLDGDLAIRVMMSCLDRDIIVYPVHDSFLTTQWNRNEVASIMRTEYEMIFNQHIRIGICA